MPSLAINSTKLSNNKYLNKMSGILKQNETAKFGIGAVMHRYFNQLMRFLFNKQIRNAYYRKGWYWYNLPFYMNIGKYKLCIYAMDMDWDSMRIKIEKDCKIVKVIKRGIF
jgi:hypothetical protein